MAERISKKKPRKDVKSSEVSETTSKPDEKAGLKKELDALIDEIDGVLEENAEEFVKSYIQKGGE